MWKPDAPADPESVGVRGQEGLSRSDAASPLTASALVKCLFSVEMGGMARPLESAAELVEFGWSSAAWSGDSRSAGDARCGLTASLCFNGGGVFLLYDLTGLACFRSGGRSLASSLTLQSFSCSREGSEGAEPRDAGRRLPSVDGRCSAGSEVGCLAPADQLSWSERAPLTSHRYCFLWDELLGSRLKESPHVGAAIPFRSLRMVASRWLSETAAVWAAPPSPARSSAPASP